MNIIYFTTAQYHTDHEEWLKTWKTPVNLSNQTFHNKLIRSLSISNKVTVISLRPFSKKRCTVKYLPRNYREDGNISWCYPRIIKSGVKLPALIGAEIRYFLAKKDIEEIKNSIIITDTINPSVSFFATRIAKRYNIPAIGICTDSPSNISGTKRAYTMLVLKLAKKLDGFIALTSGLNELFNETDKPALILEGLVEDEENIVEPYENKYGKYMFYAGALSDKYGIYNFINYFKNDYKGDAKLLICGHHVDQAKLYDAIKEDKRIIYLGNLTNKECMLLEKNAWLNINPRPFSEDLDRFSIPSKVLEYLNSGAATLSVKNTKLQKYFNPYAIWVKASNSESFAESIAKYESFTTEETIAMTKGAKEEVQKYYSLSAVNSKLDGFLYLFTIKN